MDVQRLLDRVIGVALASAALVLAVVLARREFRRPDPRPSVSAAPIYQRSWEDAISYGRLVHGQAGAPVVVMEFGDFECPFCRQFSQTLESVAKQYGSRVAIYYLHFPLTSHRFARPAARAAECAEEQGRFLAFHDALFKKQDSLGLKSWTSYAVDAQVQQIAGFESCVARSKPFDAIERGLEAGRKMGVAGTPTIVVNGWLYPGGMDSSRITQALKEALSGERRAGAK